MVMMDLSKAYNCLPHDLLTAKLAAYSVGIDCSKPTYSYLTDRKQRVKVGTSFSTWKPLSKGAPQGSILSPLLFSIFISDFFYAIEHSQVCSFADDSTIFACGGTLDEEAKFIENDITMALNWFELNEMVANPKKSS